MADQPIAVLLVRLEPVLMPQGGKLLPQGVEDGMVVVQGSEANLKTLTESKDRWRSPLGPEAGGAQGSFRISFCGLSPCATGRPAP